MRETTSRELASKIIDLQTAGFTNDKVQRLLLHLQGISVLDSSSRLFSQNLLNHLQANPHPIPSSVRTNQLMLKLTESLSVDSEDLDSQQKADKNWTIASDLRHSVSLDLVELAQEAYSTCRLPASRSLINSFQYLSAEQYRKTHRGKDKKRGRDSRKERFEQQANKRRKFQNDPSKRLLSCYFAQDLSRHILDLEDTLLRLTHMGRKQIRDADDGVTLHQRMREIVPICNNAIVSNIHDKENDTIPVLPYIAKKAQSIASFDEPTVMSLKERVTSFIPFNKLGVVLRKKKSRIVVVIFIRTSPYTDNDGLRQFVAIMMAVRHLQHAGFNIEVYPIVCYAKDSSRHEPFECKAFHQVLQILCDPNLKNCQIKIVAIDPFR